MADRGIRTVALAPGLTDTPGMRGSVDEAYIARIAASYPGGRLGQPEDVVSFAASLCSEAVILLMRIGLVWRARSVRTGAVRRDSSRALGPGVR